MSPPTLDGREDATSRRVRTFFPPPYFLAMPTYLAREKNDDTGQKKKMEKKEVNKANQKKGKKTEAALGVGLSDSTHVCTPAEEGANDCAAISFFSDK